MIKTELLGAESLDIGFLYPIEYKKFLDSVDQLDDTPWWLLGESKGLFKSCYDIINIECKSKKLLIPFAKSDETKVLACFDMSHKIWFFGLVNDDIENADWDKRYSMPNFDAWLDRVLRRDL